MLHLYCNVIQSSQAAVVLLLIIIGNWFCMRVGMSFAVSEDKRDLITPPNALRYQSRSSWLRDAYWPVYEKIPLDLDYSASEVMDL